MTQEELKQAYEWFALLSVEQQEAFDPLCEILANHLRGTVRARRGMMALPNRVSAMLAIEAVEAWEQAEWNRD